MKSLLHELGALMYYFCPVCQSCDHFVFSHDDVIKWKHFPRYWPLVREIHRSPVNFPHKGQWRGALMFTLICARINSWVNNGEAGDLRRHPGHYDVIVMSSIVVIYHILCTCMVDQFSLCSFDNKCIFIDSVIVHSSMRDSVGPSLMGFVTTLTL